MVYIALTCFDTEVPSSGSHLQQRYKSQHANLRSAALYKNQKAKLVRKSNTAPTARSTELSEEAKVARIFSQLNTRWNWQNLYETAPTVFECYNTQPADMHNSKQVAEIHQSNCTWWRDVRRIFRLLGLGRFPNGLQHPNHTVFL
jgi:hypothetical protein